MSLSHLAVSHSLSLVFPSALQTLSLSLSVYVSLPLAASSLFYWEPVRWFPFVVRLELTGTEEEEKNGEGIEAEEEEAAASGLSK